MVEQANPEVVVCAPEYNPVARSMGSPSIRIRQFTIRRTTELERRSLQALISWGAGVAMGAAWGGGWRWGAGWGHNDIEFNEQQQFRPY